MIYAYNFRECKSTSFLGNKQRLLIKWRRHLDSAMEAFTSHRWLNRFTPMSFKVKNTPSALKRAMHIISSPIQWQCTFVHLNDTVMFSCTPLQDINPISLVNSLNNEACVTLQLTMCHFLTNKIDYPGHIIRSGWHRVTCHKTDDIEDLNTTTRLIELCYFIDLCNCGFQLSEILSTNLRCWRNWFWKIKRIS